MQTIKERAFGFRALVQKIWDHIKYRKGYGTPDFQEGFLGISTMGWFFFQSKMREQIVRILTYLLIAGMIYLLWLSYLISD